MTTPRTINGTSFDGTGNINSAWAWNKKATYNTAGTIELIKANTATGSNGHSSCFICHFGNYGSVGNFVTISYTVREKAIIQAYGVIPDGYKIKYNDKNIYLEAATYTDIFVTKIKGDDSTNCPQIGSLQTVSEVPEDLQDVPVISYQELITGEQGQVVGFDENGNAIAADIGGTNILTGTNICTIDSEGLWSDGQWKR